MFHNDFADLLEYCNLITYADDTVIFISNKSVSNTETKLNMDLEKVSTYFLFFILSTYFHLNALVINIKKGKWFESSVEKWWKPFKCHV